MKLAAAARLHGAACVNCALYASDTALLSSRLHTGSLCENAQGTQSHAHLCPAQCSLVLQKADLRGQAQIHVVGNLSANVALQLLQAVDSQHLGSVVIAEDGEVDLGHLP